MRRIEPEIAHCYYAAVFVFYDWWVERRQRIVMDSAMRSNAVSEDDYEAH